LKSNEPRGELKINSITLTSDKTSARITGNVTIVKNTDSGTESKDVDLFFEVSKTYKRYLLSERCDAFVILFLHFAVVHGYNITSSVPMSSDLYYNIKDGLLPIMVKNGGNDISISAEVADPPKAGKAVGTGLSCGVDSLSAIRAYIDHPDEDKKLTHLCINDVGAFNSIYSNAGIDNVKRSSYERAREAANMIGLPLIESSSNVNEEFNQNHHLTHTYSSMFAVYCLSKLWKTYHYASAGVDHVSKMDMNEWYKKEPAEYEPILFRYFSTRRLLINSADALSTRLDKIRSIADYDVAHKYLYSCTSSSTNCGVCDKCIRNLTSLDYLGKLDQFSEVYDLERYRNLRAYCFWYVSNHRNSDMFSPVYRALIDSKDETMLKIRSTNRAVTRFDTLWAKNNPESDAIALKALLPYRFFAVRVSKKIIEAYSSERLTPNPSLVKKCRKYIIDQYCFEIDNGLERSRYV